MTTPIRLHRHPLSGHSHRVELFLNLAGVRHELVEVDLAGGEHKSPGFLALNIFGQVPVIEDEDVTLADSNAILTYLAERYAPDWYGEDARARAEIQRFLSIAAGPIAYGPAAARLVNVFGAPIDQKRPQEIADWIFERLNAHLKYRDWLVGDQPSIADVAIYSYTAHAPEGDVSLEGYPYLRALLRRIEGLPGFKPMQATAVGLAAA